MNVLRHCKDWLFTFQILFQAIPLRFQSALVFRCDVRRVFGVTSTSWLCVKDMCLGVFMSYTPSCHGALYSFKAFTRPLLPNSRYISWYQKTIKGIGNIIISAWTARFCCLSHKEMNFFSHLLFCFLNLWRFQLPGGGAEVLLLFRSLWCLWAQSLILADTYKLFGYRIWAHFYIS